MIKREFSDVAMNMLRTSYFNKDETSVDELFNRVAYAFSSSSEMAERIKGYLHAKWLSTATPITANAPVRIAAFDTDADDMTRFDSQNFKPTRNLPISCNLLHVPDTIKGIVEHASESRYLSIFGAGLGANWSNVRPAGSKSPGPIPFLKTHDDDTLAYFQGQTRRGAYAAYLSVYHPYIRQFIHLRDPAHLADENVKTFNIHNAVILDDAFMDAARDNRNIKLIDPNTKEVVEEINARDLWFEILEVRGRTGEPFLINIDRVIEKFPPSQLALGLLPSMSNLCFTGDTLVATADGRNAVRIDQLASESNGITEFPVYAAVKNKRTRTDNSKTVIANAVAFKTGSGVEVITVRLSDGTEFKCTPDHKLCKTDGTWVSAKHSVGCELMPFNSYKSGKKYRSINSVSNGHAKQHLMIYKHHHGAVKHGCEIDHIDNDSGDFIDNLAAMNKAEHKRKTVSECMEGYKNPIRRFSERQKLNQAESTVFSRNGNYSGVTDDHIIEIAKIVHASGKPITIKSMRDVDSSIPKTLSKNRIGGGGIAALRKICNGEIEWNGSIEPNTNTRTIYETVEKRSPATVVCIEPSGMEDVYDLTVNGPENFYIITKGFDDSFVESTGVLVHNCTEITLAVNEERTAVCCLSSPNAEYFDEWAPVADQFIGDVTEYLDNVLEYYIRNAPDELRKAKFSAMRERAIGIGTIGFHAYLQRNMIAFESAVARSAAKRIQKTIQDSAIKRSLELGARRGEAPDMVGTGRRNSHLTAIAPNASTSNILTTSPSIEPYRANAYRQRIQTGQIFIRNRYLEKLLESKGANTPEVWDRIKGADGSVAGLSDILTEYERDVFKTALEINQMWLVEHAEARQDHLCQAQSLNLFFKPGVDIRHLHAVHWRAMRKLKTLYYMRSTAIINADRQVKIEVDDNFVTNPDIVVDQRNMFDPGACLSCEG